MNLDNLSEVVELSERLTSLVDFLKTYGDSNEKGWSLDIRLGTTKVTLIGNYHPAIAVREAIRTEYDRVLAELQAFGVFVDADSTLPGYRAKEDEL